MVTGSCLCGSVRYAVDGRISPIVLCHCAKCRRSTGSAFHPGAVCRKSRFRWTAGEDAITAWRSESGYERPFCRHCGALVPMFQRDGEFVVLHAGSLDGDPATRPERHIFVGSKAPWHEITDDLPQSEAYPADTEA